MGRSDRLIIGRVPHGPIVCGQRRELAIVVDERAADCGMPGRDHLPDDECVIADRKAIYQRERQPGQGIIEDGQAERVPMPARSRAELRRVRPAEEAREIHLVVGEQVNHNVLRHLDGPP